MQNLLVMSTFYLQCRCSHGCRPETECLDSDLARCCWRCCCVHWLSPNLLHQR